MKVRDSEALINSDLSIKDYCHICQGDNEKMKNILITGTDSYIGNSVRDWLSREPGKYSVELLDMREASWKQADFSRFDVVFHVAGIAHVSSDSKMESLYYKVNRDLTVETAKKAKAGGVKQFIFMSSIIVYGNTRGNDGMIDRNSIPAPDNFYGNSKLQAEDGIRPLASEDFKIVVLRPPMIYGKGSKGNYPRLANFALKSPFFPDLENHRSMLHIDNLCEFIRLMIDNEESGLFFPQNAEYVRTGEMAALIARVHGRRFRPVRAFNGLLRLLERNSGFFNKAFGNLTYEKSMSEYKDNYQVRDFEASIALTEK